MPSRTPAVKKKFKESFQAIFIGVCQVVEITKDQALSKNFSSGASIVRLISTEDFFISIGLAPAVSTDSMYFPKDVVEYFGISEGQKLAAISASGKSGKLYITEAAG